jgi:hypothetical protein
MRHVVVREARIAAEPVDGENHPDLSFPDHEWHP